MLPGVTQSPGSAVIIVSTSGMTTVRLIAFERVAVTAELAPSSTEAGERDRLTAAGAVVSLIVTATLLGDPRCTVSGRAPREMLRVSLSKSSSVVVIRFDVADV